MTQQPADEPVASPVTTVPADGSSLPDPSATPDIATPPPTKQQRKADDPLRGSKASGLYAGVIGLGIVLILLIIFIAQNTRKAPIHFLWLDGHAPIAVMLLIATAAGLFIAGIASLLRIIQLRSRVKHERKARKKR